MSTTTSTPRSTDLIEKQVHVSAQRARVWRAIANAEEFGTWFGIKLDGPFTPGRSLSGRLTIPNYEHVTLEIQVERVDPESYFSYRWHPAAIDPKVDYRAEPMTLVEFRLADAEGGTLVTIIESGFDQLPASRRAEAFRMNDGGWTGQSKKLAGYVG